MSSPQLRAAAARWAADDPALAELADPAALLAAGQDMTDVHRLGKVVLAMTRLTSTDTGRSQPRPAPNRDLAVRVLLQMLLPAVRLVHAQTSWADRQRAAARERLWSVADGEERAQILLALLLHGIRTYRWQTRRGPANLNLINHMRTRFIRQIARERETAALHIAWFGDPAALETPGHVDSRDRVVARRHQEDREPDAGELLATVLRWGTSTGALSPAAATLIAQRRILDRPVTQLAADHGILPKSVERRLERAERALTAAARAAGAAAVLAA